MKLGTETGSMTNHLYSRMTKGQPEPTVGMGATILMWTDRKAGTVVDVMDNIIAVQEDTAKRVDDNGMSESQEYEYTPNPDAPNTWFRREKAGNWVEVFVNRKTNRWNKGGGRGLRLGERRQYRDVSF